MNHPENRTNEDSIGKQQRIGECNFRAVHAIMSATFNPFSSNRSSKNLSSSQEVFKQFVKYLEIENSIEIDLRQVQGAQACHSSLWNQLLQKKISKDASKLVYR
jgi:hypothetical protein